jgi:hypothetical protein
LNGKHLITEPNELEVTVNKSDAIRLFEESMPRDLEQKWLTTVFDVLDVLPALCADNCLSAEAHYSGGYFRRTLLDKRILPIVIAAGGEYRPGYTYANGVATSHYALFLIGKQLKVTNAYSNDRFGGVRNADYRDSLISGSALPLPLEDFLKLEPPAGERVYAQFRYSCLDETALVPIKAKFNIYDQDGSVVAPIDVISRNRDMISARLPLIEDKVGAENEALVTLKRALRQKEAHE